MSDAEQSRPRHSRGRWWYLLHVTVVALHPLSIFLLPWRAGKRDARMAITLLRVDPVRRRRYLSAACYTIVGLYKTLMVGWAALIALIFLTPLFGFQPAFGVGWIGQVLIAIIAVIALSTACAAGLTFATTLCAAVLRQKLWIDIWADPEIAQSGRWPPVSNRTDLRNCAGFLAILPPVLIPVSSVLYAIRFPPGWMLSLAAISGTLPAIWIARRIVAQTPAECYPESPVLTSESPHEDEEHLID